MVSASSAKNYPVAVPDLGHLQDRGRGLGTATNLSLNSDSTKVLNFKDSDYRSELGAAVTVQTVASASG